MVFYRCSHDCFLYCEASPDCADLMLIGQVHVGEGDVVVLDRSRCKLSPADCGHAKTASAYLAAEAAQQAGVLAAKTAQAGTRASRPWKQQSPRR